MVAFLTTALDPNDYDSFHKGQRVMVQYLQQRDIPKVPMAKTLGRMRMLPVARMTGRSFFSGIETFLHSRERSLLLWIGGVALLLIIWRVAGWPRFGWAVAVCCMVGFAAVMIDDFPTTTPAPANDVRQATAHVATIDLVDRLFNGTRSRGFDAAQPIQYVAVEFVPAGRTETVMAIDAIDAGSMPAIKPDAQVAVDYEAATPRTAHIRAATRTFPARNLRGIGFEIAACIAVVVGILLFANWLGGAWKRLLGSR
jgi:hypothetical protein